MPAWTTRWNAPACAACLARAWRTRWAMCCPCNPARPARAQRAGKPGAGNCAMTAFSCYPATRPWAGACPWIRCRGKRPQSAPCCTRKTRLRRAKRWLRARTARRFGKHHPSPARPRSTQARRQCAPLCAWSCAIRAAPTAHPSPPRRPSRAASFMFLCPRWPRWRTTSICSLPWKTRRRRWACPWCSRAMRHRAIRASSSCR